MSLAARGRARSVDSFRTTIVEKGYFSLCLCRLDSERPSHTYPVDHDQQPTPTLSDAFIPQIPNHSESQDFRKRMPRHIKQLKQWGQSISQVHHKTPDNTTRRSESEPRQANMVGSRGSDRLTVIAAGVIHIQSLAHTLCNLSLLSVSAFHGRYGGPFFFFFYNLNVLAGDVG